MESTDNGTKSFAEERIIYYIVIKEPEEDNMRMEVWPLPEALDSTACRPREKV